MPEHDRPAAAAGRWLLLVQQLPTRPSSVRIRTWRRLQQLGSVVLKNSVYVLPYSPQAREDFEWLAAEIRAARGQAAILAAEALTAAQDEEIREAFRAARSPDYQALRKRAMELLRKAPARPSGTIRRALERSWRACRDELAAIEAIDFGRAPGRQAAAAAVDALASRLRSSPERTDVMKDAAHRLDPAAYAGRTWVTRPRPGIDRMASAWLIQRFIDPAATFAFADSGALPRKRQVPFDVFDAEFGHQGDRCTFETLCHRFGIDDPAVRRIAEIVHDADLKDRRYGPPEAPVVAGLVEGLRAACADDGELLRHGATMFAGLYESFQQAASGPMSTRPVKRRRRGRHRR
jgi:hypothetical protein